jgi:hypothetical protein
MADQVDVHVRRVKPESTPGVPLAVGTRVGLASRRLEIVGLSTQSATTYPQ